MAARLLSSLATAITALGCASAMAAGEHPLPQAADTMRGNPNQAQVAPSDQSRASVKSQTRDANRRGDLAAAGEAPLPQSAETAHGTPNQAARQPSTVSRSDVKADTREAAAEGTLRPAGEAVKPLNASRVR